MKFISALAAFLLVSDTSAIRTQSSSALILNAREMVDVNSEAYTHLTNALYGLPSNAAPTGGAGPVAEANT